MELANGLEIIYCCLLRRKSFEIEISGHFYTFL